MLEPRHMSERREAPVRGRRPVPEVTASVRDAAATFEATPPTPEDIAGTQGAQVVLPPDSAAAAGAKGVYPTIEQNTLLRDAGYMEMGLDPQDPSNELTDPEVPPEPPPGGGNGGTAAEAPVNNAVPAVTQSGNTLDCTMGEWSGTPTSYAYAWQMDGAPVGSDSATHTVVAGDGGKTATCVVTATNATGSTAAPPSNGVVVTEPA
jgi:hypothetical protein